MKLLKRKTRKAIDKSVRKALKKHGPALVTGLAAALASSLATLAKTEAAGKRGTSNLADMVARAGETLAGDGRPRRAGSAKKKHLRPVNRAAASSSTPA